MFDEFLSYMKTHAELSESELELLYSRATERIVRKKEIILGKGEICRYKILVIKGLLRTYRTKEDGTEYIIQFSPENHWTTDPESYENRTPSNYIVDALEDSRILLWTKKDFDEFLSVMPELKLFSEKVKSASLSISRQRIFSAISSSAEEKYDEFISTHPGVFARVPLHMVASYLGLSRETLSRVRNAQVKR
ncbi:Crp/Fnr family transcriptional regulator [Mucilaginibacter terrenus]|uniref:Crp/Fnr family transcriptional regulator n=2 Tax=Mucilaginibacter terrenus TaxID=2482727 RepID=A0A3E2NLC1_9SPHI|nr:Crp/Fnr family transcriptional regulator [Mucilaginibacter terrenus]